MIKIVTVPKWDIWEAREEEDLAEFPDKIYLTTPYLCGRKKGNCSGRAMFLDPKYNWEIVEDSEGVKVLIAMKKVEDTNLSGT